MADTCADATARVGILALSVTGCPPDGRTVAACVREVIPQKPVRQKPDDTPNF
jgi:hypothetical protein